MRKSSPRRLTTGAAVILGAMAALSTSILAGCSDGAPPNDPGTASDPSALRGELVAYVADFDDGTSHTDYALRGDDGTETTLKFARPPELQVGQRIKVHGELHDGAIEVTSYAVDSAGARADSLIGVTPNAPRRMAVFLVDLTGTGYNGPTADAVSQQFFEGPKSVDAYYGENSYGKQGLVGDVLGPFTYTMTGCGTSGNTSDTSKLATAMKAMATGTYDQYGYVMTKTNLCQWSGLGAVGTPTRPARDTWYNGSIGCVVTVQEPGHNYGMQHSSSMACGTSTFVDAPDGTCTHSEYGDTFDPMGGGCRHMNVWQKQYEQWFGGCNAVKVTQSGVFYVLPTELACDGIQALQIPMPHSRPFSHAAATGGTATSDTLTSYYLEYRTSVGFDNGMTPTVLLHVGGDYRNQTQSGLHTWLLDMHPGGTQGFRDAGFVVGQTFTDPAGGVSITVQAMDSDKATIQVDITGGTGAAPTCLDGSTVAAPGPIVCTSTPVGSGDGGVVRVDAGPPPPPRDAGAGTTTTGGGTSGTGTTGRTSTSSTGSTATGGASGSATGATIGGGSATASTSAGGTTGIRGTGTGSSTTGATAGASTSTQGASGGSATAGVSAGLTSSSTSAGATAGTATSAGGTAASGGSEGAATAAASAGSNASAGATAGASAGVGATTASADSDSGASGSCALSPGGNSRPSNRRNLAVASTLLALGMIRLRRRSRRPSPHEAS